MPITYEELEERDGTIYKKGVEGGLATPYATPEDLAVDLGIGSDQIDWGAIGQYTPPVPQEVPQDIPAGATVEDILGQDAYGDELAGAEAGYYETLTPEYRQESREQSDADIMKKYQQEIDALEAERVAARGRIVSQYGQIGEARAGTSTAAQARRGLVGSTFGTQQKREVATQTQREQEAALAYSSAQYAERRRAIMGDVRTAQSEEAKIRLEAAQLGSQAKIEEIRGRKERSDERVSTAIRNLLGMEADVNDEELMNEVAGELGISVRDLMSKYQTSKSEAEEQAETERLERRKLEAEGQTIMKPGELLYDSEGNLIAEGTKEAGKTITLKPGEIVVDAEGNTIAQGLEEEEELLSPTEAEKLGVAYGTTKKQAADMGIFMTGDEDMIGSLSGDQWDRLVKLRTETAKDPDVKQFIEIRNSYDRLVESGRDPSAAGDLALIFNYMKMLDPGSVVRESEFATAANSGSIPEIIRARYNKTLAGERLSDEMRKDFMDRGHRLYQPRKRNYDKAIDFWKTEAEEIGVPMDRVIRDYTTPAEESSSDIWSEDGESGGLWADWEDSGGNQDFNGVGGDTNKATLNVLSKEKEGLSGGQCGRFVNKIAGLGVGDSYDSKMAKMDKSIKTPKAGMAFLMPYKETGHCGFITSIKNGIATVKDSNWSLDKKIKTHTIPINKMTGFAYNRLT